MILKLGNMSRESNTRKAKKTSCESELDVKKNKRVLGCLQRNDAHFIRVWMIWFVMAT